MQLRSSGLVTPRRRPLRCVHWSIGTFDHRAAEPIPDTASTCSWTGGKGQSDWILGAEGGDKQARCVERAGVHFGIRHDPIRGRAQTHTFHLTQYAKKPTKFIHSIQLLHLRDSVKILHFKLILERYYKTVMRLKGEMYLPHCTLFTCLLDIHFTRSIRPKWP